MAVFLKVFKGSRWYLCDSSRYLIFYLTKMYSSVLWLVEAFLVACLQ